LPCALFSSWNVVPCDDVAVGDGGSGRRFMERTWYSTLAPVPTIPAKFEKATRGFTPYWNKIHLSADVEFADGKKITSNLMPLTRQGLCG